MFKEGVLVVMNNPLPVNFYSVCYVLKLEEPQLGEMKGLFFLVSCF